jgi:predicted transposase YdaD
MALTYNIKRDIRYQQGIEAGQEKGMKKGREEGIGETVKNLLLKTQHSVKEIADIAEVPITFVETIKNQLA